MHDYGKFCYLDVQKTGSSFISDFLKRHSAVEQKEFAKHGRISTPERLGEGKLFFISCRDPLEQYKSLYFFGMGRKGRLYATLNAAGYAERFYDGTAEGFSNWVEFILDPANFGVLSEEYRERTSKIFGFQTHRFLLLSFYQPVRTIATIRDAADLERVYGERKIHEYVLRNETLNSDLIRLIEERLHPYLRDPAKATAQLSTGPVKKNPSVRLDRSGDFAVRPGAIRRIREREWFFFDVLGYGDEAYAV